jgi:hypothetical protein
MIPDVERIAEISEEIHLYLAKTDRRVMEGALACQVASVEIYTGGLEEAIRRSITPEKIRQHYELFTEHWQKIHELTLKYLTIRYGPKIVYQICPRIITLGTLLVMADNGMEITITIKDHNSMIRLNLEKTGITITDQNNPENILKHLYPYYDENELINNLIDYIRGELKR